MRRALVVGEPLAGPFWMRSTAARCAWLCGVAVQCRGC